MFDSSFFVALAFFLFIGLLIWKKVPGLIAGALDRRAAEIKNELETARGLREEAQALLARHQREQRDAAERAQEMIAAAEREAKTITEEAEHSLNELIARRESLARDKIARAEADAVKEVRQVAAAAATAAAAELIARHLQDKDQDALISASISDLGKRLH